MDHQVEDDPDLRAAHLVGRETLGRDVPRPVGLLLEERHHRVEVLDVADLHEAALGARRREHPLRLLEGGAYGLLDQQVASPLEERERDLGVPAIPKAIVATIIMCSSCRNRRWWFSSA